MKRRAFNQWTLAAGCTLALPSFANSYNGRTLVILHLKGANDGLNTLVPYDSDDYRKLRPNIAFSADDVIPIADSANVGALGLHSELSELADSVSEDCAVLTGVGYPSQNRSHFKSAQIWASGSDGNRMRRQGWVTESVERTHDRSVIDLHGASLSGGLDVFADGAGEYVSMARLNQISGLQAKETAMTGNPLLDLVQQRTQTLAKASQALDAKLKRARYLPHRMPHGELSGQLTEALRVIGSDAEIPVLHVQLDGFDTHEGQVRRHRRLLRELSEALDAFKRNLKSMGKWDQTLVMTYAEFGRRAAENGSQGTDHGTANTHFVMGGRVKGGVYGQHPRLDRLVDGDMQFGLDYRAMYHEVAQHWWQDLQAPWAEFQDSELKGLLV